MAWSFIQASETSVEGSSAFWMKTTAAKFGAVEVTLTPQIDLAVV